MSTLLMDQLATDVVSAPLIEPTWLIKDAQKRQVI